MSDLRAAFGMLDEMRAQMERLRDEMQELRSQVRRRRKVGSLAPSEHYRVQKGDTLMTVVRRTMGSDDPDLIHVLVAENPELNWSSLKVGEIVRVPVLDREVQVDFTEAPAGRVPTVRSLFDSLMRRDEGREVRAGR